MYALYGFAIRHTLLAANYLSTELDAEFGGFNMTKECCIVSIRLVAKLRICQLFRVGYTDVCRWT